jgi:phosphoglucosamine mutase
MREIGASLGGEQSGHIIFLNENTTGDGLLSALHLLEVIKLSGKKLSELAKVMEVLPQALCNAKVPTHKKDKYLEYSEIKNAIQALGFRAGTVVSVSPIQTDRMMVSINGQSFGIWDALKKTFVD